MSKIPEVGGELESSVPRLHTCFYEEIQTPLKINWDVPKKKKTEKKTETEECTEGHQTGAPKMTPSPGTPRPTPF